MIKEVSNETFEDEVLNHDGLVMIDFWADWCQPCKKLSPTIEQIAIECPQVKVVKVNVDKEMDLAMDFNVQGVPTVFLLDKGKVLEEFSGAKPKDFILDLIDPWL